MRLIVRDWLCKMVSVSDVFILKNRWGLGTNKWGKRIISKLLNDTEHPRWHDDYECKSRRESVMEKDI